MKIQVIQMSGCNLISQVFTCVQKLDLDVILTKHVAYFFVSIELCVTSVRFTAYIGMIVNFGDCNFFKGFYYK